MFLRKTGLILLASAVFLTACKKEKNSSSAPDECVEGRAAIDGDIVEGRYIVAYDPTTSFP